MAIGTYAPSVLDAQQATEYLPEATLESELCGGPGMTLGVGDSSRPICTYHMGFLQSENEGEGGGQGKRRASLSQFSIFKAMLCFFSLLFLNFGTESVLRTWHCLEASLLCMDSLLIRLCRFHPQGLLSCVSFLGDISIVDCVVFPPSTLVSCVSNPFWSV